MISVDWMSWSYLWRKRQFLSTRRAWAFAREIKGTACVLISNRDGTFDFV